MKKILVACVLSALCAPAFAEDAAPTAFRFADFSAGTAEKTTQGGTVSNYGYSEKPGDNKINGMSKVETAVVLDYMISNKKGSGYAGASIRVNGPADAETNLSEYKALKIKVSAKDTGLLDIRVVGNEEKVRDAGCYATASLKVTPELTEYTLKFSDFAPGSWCGGNGRSIKKTIDKVVSVEAIDDNLKGERASTFAVESIEFVK